MWLVYGAWAWLIASSLVIFNTRGDIAAANHALPGIILVLLLHGGVWLYKKNKRPTQIQRHATKPEATSVDGSIYDQIASEMSNGDINGGLMARAIAEACGDKDKTMALYINLRATAIAKDREQPKHDDAEKGADAWESQTEEDAKAFLDTNENQRSVERHWSNVMMHRVGIVILWIFILNFVLAITLVLYMQLNGTSMSGASSGLDLAIVAFYAGVATLGYLGTQKLKW